MGDHVHRRSDTARAMTGSIKSTGHDETEIDMGALDYLGAVKDPTRAIAKEIAEKFDLPDYPAPYNGPVMWGYNAGGAEHGTGRSIDFMIRNTPAVVDEIAEYLWANRERFGLIHMIWKRRIKSTKVDPGNWRYMGDRGSPTENHMDHIHVLFDGRPLPDGGAQDGPPVVIPEPDPEYWEGAARDVRLIQALVGVTVDGYYGDDTIAAVKVYQRTLGVTADGYWGPATEAAYLAARKAAEEPEPLDERYYEPQGVEMSVEEIQKAVGVTVDGYYGEATRAAVKALQTSLGVTADGLWGPATEEAYRAKSVDSKPSARKPSAPKFPLPKGSYFGPEDGPRESVSGFHGHREDLRAWQKRMKDRGWRISADGRYGDKTEAVVKKFQKEKGLTVDGLIGPKTWAAAWKEPVT